MTAIVMRDIFCEIWRNYGYLRPRIFTMPLSIRISINWNGIRLVSMERQIRLSIWTPFPLYLFRFSEMKKTD